MTVLVQFVCLFFLKKNKFNLTVVQTAQMSPLLNSLFLEDFIYSDPTFNYGALVH